MFLYNTGARATEVIGLTVEQLVLTSSPLRQVDVCVDLTTACWGHDNPAQAHRGPARRDPDHRLEGPDALVRSIPAYACCRKIDKDRDGCHRTRTGRLRVGHRHNRPRQRRSDGLTRITGSRNGKEKISQVETCCALPGAAAGQGNPRFDSASPKRQYAPLETEEGPRRTTVLR